MRPMGDVDRIDTLGVISIYYIMCDAKLEEKVSVRVQLYEFPSNYMIYFFNFKHRIIYALHSVKCGLQLV